MFKDIKSKESLVMSPDNIHVSIDDQIFLHIDNHLKDYNHLRIDKLHMKMKELLGYYSDEDEDDDEDDDNEDEDEEDEDEDEEDEDDDENPI